MEKWPWEQFKLPWSIPKPLSSKEMDEANAELRRAGNYEKRKGREGSKEETTEAIEEEGAKHIRILSPKESAKEAAKVVEKLEKDEEERGSRDKKKE